MAVEWGIHECMKHDTFQDTLCSKQLNSVEGFGPSEVSWLVA